MKKISILALCLMALGTFGFASSALASAAVGPSNGSISMHTGSNPALTVGLSPKVSAYYVNPGTSDATAQWFAMSTAHPGGNIIYGTAQDVNNIYQKGFTTGTALTSTNMATPAVAGSSAAWTGASWSATP